MPVCACVSVTCKLTVPDKSIGEAVTVVTHSVSHGLWTIKHGEAGGYTHRTVGCFRCVCCLLPSCCCCFCPRFVWQCGSDSTCICTCCCCRCRTQRSSRLRNAHHGDIGVCQSR